MSLTSLQSLHFFDSFLLLHRGGGGDEAEASTMSPSQRDYQVQMAKRLHGGPLEEGRILAFQNKVATEVSTVQGSRKAYWQEVFT